CTSSSSRCCAIATKSAPITRSSPLSCTRMAMVMPVRSSIPGMPCDRGSAQITSWRGRTSSMKTPLCLTPPKLMRSIRAHGSYLTSNLRRMSVELEEVHSFLASIEPFRHLPEEELVELAPTLTVRYIRRGEIILDYEESNDFLRIIRSGAIDILGPDNVLLDRR